MDDNLSAIHPIEPASVPNVFRGLQNLLPASFPPSLHNSSTMQLMVRCEFYAMANLKDGGMSNNIPFYPLLRRNVDIIIAIDSSADIRTTPWFERTDVVTPLLQLELICVGIC